MGWRLRREHVYVARSGTLGQVGLALTADLLQQAIFAIWVFNPNLSGLQLSWMPKFSLPELPSKCHRFNLFGKGARICNGR